MDGMLNNIVGTAEKRLSEETVENVTQRKDIKNMKECVNSICNT